MVVPAPIACAAQNGNVTAVEAWLNEGGDVNDCDELNVVARGRATPKKWSPRGQDRRAIEFIVKIGDNGIAWKILSFWKET